MKKIVVVCDGCRLEIEPNSDRAVHYLTLVDSTIRVEGDGLRTLGRDYKIIESDLCFHDTSCLAAWANNN